MTPGLVGEPFMVNVLPLLVCPYANTVPVYIQNSYLSNHLIEGKKCLNFKQYF